MSSILGIGGPVLIIILGGTGFGVGIYNLKKNSDMKKPLKMLNKMEKPNSETNEKDESKKESKDI